MIIFTIARSTQIAPQLLHSGKESGNRNSVEIVGTRQTFSQRDQYTIAELLPFMAGSVSLSIQLLVLFHSNVLTLARSFQ